MRDPSGKIVADLNKEGLMFIAARGGAGGHGNHFFATATLKTPQVAEVGGQGEVRRYLLELKGIAHIGLVSTSQI